MKANLSSLQTKIMPIIFGLALFAVAFSAVKGMAYGNTTNVKMLAGLVVVAGIMLALDKYYWLVLPFLYTLGLPIPGLPVSLREVGILLILGFYVLRLTLQKEKTTKPCGLLLITFPFLLWIFVVWCLNPTGFAFLGSSTVGAKSYIMILLGVFAALVMATKSINDSDSKKLFTAIVCGQVVQTIFVFLKSSAFDDAIDGERDARYEYLFGMFFYFLLFSRYGLSEILKLNWKFFAACACVFLSIYSGKRRALAVLALLPLLRTIFTGKNKMQTLACFLVAFFMLSFAAVADGTFYELPNSVRRSLSTIMPKYRTTEHTLDVFRFEVRQYGNQVIRESPWFGRKGYVMDLRNLVWMTDNKTNNFESAAYTSNWHSTWYSYACDFGVPCAIFFGIALLYTLICSKNLLKKTNYGSWSFVCVLYFTFNIYVEAIFSFTTGHSSHTTMQLMYNIGMLIALNNGLKQDKQMIVMKKSNRAAENL